MNKEDSIAEIKHDIRTLQQKIEDLRKEDEVNFGAIAELEKMIDEKENSLKELTTETAQNSGTDFEDAQEKEAEREMQEEEEKNTQAEEIKKEQDEEASSKQEEMNKEFVNEEEAIDDNPLTLTDWQKKTGIEIIPDDYIKNKYSEEMKDNKLDEKTFRAILANENVPKIIQEPGKAEMYLKTSEDWENVRTSKSALEEAIRNENFPVECVNEESYILLEYDKGEVNANKKEDKEGKTEIDENDIREALGEETVEVEELKVSSSDEEKVLGNIDVYKSGAKTYIKATDVAMYMAVEQAIEEAQEIEKVPQFIQSSNNDLGGVSEEEKASTTTELLNNLMNPYVEPEHTEEHSEDKEFGERKLF